MDPCSSLAELTPMVISSRLLALSIINMLTIPRFTSPAQFLSCFPDFIFNISYGCEIGISNHSSSYSLAISKQDNSFPPDVDPPDVDVKPLESSSVPHFFSYPVHQQIYQLHYFHRPQSLLVSLLCNVAVAAYLVSQFLLLLSYSLPLSRQPQILSKHKADGIPSMLKMPQSFPYHEVKSEAFKSLVSVFPCYLSESYFQSPSSLLVVYSLFLEYTKHAIASSLCTCSTRNALHIDIPWAAPVLVIILSDLVK